MNEIEYDRMQEDAAIGQMICENLEAILANHDAANVFDLYRKVYRYTECGAWLSVQLHDGTWVHCDKLHSVDNGNVRALLVEGSDAEVCANPIDLIDYETPEDAIKAFNEAVERVDDATDCLWDVANDE